MGHVALREFKTYWKWIWSKERYVWFLLSAILKDMTPCGFKAYSCKTISYCSTGKENTSRVVYWEMIWPHFENIYVTHKPFNCNRLSFSFFVREQNNTANLHVWSQFLQISARLWRSSVFDRLFFVQISPRRLIKLQISQCYVTELASELSGSLTIGVTTSCQMPLQHDGTGVKDHPRGTLGGCWAAWLSGINTVQNSHWNVPIVHSGKCSCHRSPHSHTPTVQPSSKAPFTSLCPP